MAVILRTTLSKAFSWLKMYGFRLRFHWSLFLGVQLRIFQQWCGWWLGTDHATSHFLHKLLFCLLTHICVTRPQLYNHQYINLVGSDLSIQFFYSGLGYFTIAVYSGSSLWVSVCCSTKLFVTVKISNNSKLCHSINAKIRIVFKTFQQHRKRFENMMSSCRVIEGSQLSNENILGFYLPQVYWLYRFSVSNWVLVR